MRGALSGLVALGLVARLAGPAGAEQPFTVAGYCAAFARAYCTQQALTYEAQSIQTAPLSEVMRFLANVFQPPDATFTAGYQCTFRARTQAGQSQLFSVGLFLARTLPFAEHTQWARLQILPIAYVTDAATGRAGYGVFKYLEEP